jgi:hypothetical protein
MTTFALRRSLAGSRIRAAAAGCAVLESDVELISVAGAVVAAFSARGASEADLPLAQRPRPTDRPSRTRLPRGYAGPINPFASAKRTSSARVSSRSLRMMWARWVSTVRTEM